MYQYTFDPATNMLCREKKEIEVLGEDFVALLLQNYNVKRTTLSEPLTIIKDSAGNPIGPLSAFLNGNGKIVQYVVQLQQINLHCPWTEQDDKIVPVLNAGHARRTAPLNPSTDFPELLWQVPEDHPHYLVFTPDSPNVYLVALKAINSNPCLLRLPLPNIFPDGRLCYANDARHKTEADRVEKYIRRWSQSQWNTDLYREGFQQMYFLKTDNGLRQNAMPNEALASIETIPETKEITEVLCNKLTQ